VTRRRLNNPALHARKQRKKKREAAKYNDNGKRKMKNKMEAFQSFFQAILPHIKEAWTDRCIDRNTPVLGGQIVAEYDALSRKVMHLYTVREMVLPEDEIKIFDKTLEVRLEDTNQQIKKWLIRWRPVIDHSMKRVKEMAQMQSKPIWRYFTADKPAKTKVTRRVATRKHGMPKKLSNNPLANKCIQ
jgi:hypothetical protein